MIRDGIVVDDNGEEGRSSSEVAASPSDEEDHSRVVLTVAVVGEEDNVPLLQQKLEPVLELVAEAIALVERHVPVLLFRIVVSDEDDAPLQLGDSVVGFKFLDRHTLQPRTTDPPTRVVVAVDMFLSLCFSLG
jgi:hypothetical protein